MQAGTGYLLCPAMQRICCSHAVVLHFLVSNSYSKIQKWVIFPFFFTLEMVYFNFNFFSYFVEYDSNFKLIQQQEFRIPDHLMIHDWAFTDTHYILFANRIKLDVLGKNIVWRWFSLFLFFVIITIFFSHTILFLWVFNV